jgi:hypothetical protein
MPTLSRLAFALALALPLAAAAPRGAAAQWATVYDQFYYPARHNWVFRQTYPFADRLFNAFDYGHSILYEELWTRPNAAPARLEVDRYDFLTRRVLPNPPRVPLEETAIEIQYARLAPEARMMFEWAHLLHRQAYDVLADERLGWPEKDAEMAKLLAYYKSRPDVAFSSKPKSMKLMQEQPYSLAFRKQYPKFNGLIWGYHWLQVGLYEPLVVGRTFDERQALASATVARFRQMLNDPPRSMPYLMPMTAAVAPEFANRYPEVAIIFDNLHSMHDVVSDILANESVPRAQKRPEILRAGARFRDDTSFVMTEQAWRTMARHMGVENMGGAAVGFATALPTPTVTYGAVMTHDDRTGEMTGFKYGAATGPHGGHETAANPPDSAPASAHPAAEHHATVPDRSDSTEAREHAAPERTATPERLAPSMELQMRMLEDPVIRRRLLADTAARRLVTEMVPELPAEQRARMERILRDTAVAGAAGARVRRPAAKSPAKPARSRRPAARPTDPHSGHPAPAPAKRDSTPTDDHSHHPPSP